MNAAGVPDWFIDQAARGCPPGEHSSPGDAIRLGGIMAACERETPDYDPDRDGYIWDPDHGPQNRRRCGCGCGH